MTKSRWLRTDEEQNAIDFLAKTNKFIEESYRDKWAWKWVAISLHGALYGFAVSVAKGTNDSSVLTKNGKLIDFDEALNRCRNAHNLITSSGEDFALSKLKGMMRNGFVHYQPGLWAIEISGMPQICLDALRVLRYLAIEVDVFRHSSNYKQSLIKSYIFQSRRLLRNHPLTK